MRILVIGDPPKMLNPASDTSYYLSRAAMKRGHQVDWTTSGGVLLEGTEVSFRVQPILDWERDGAPALGEDACRPSGDYQAVWIRKEPPMGEQFVQLCWLLGLLESKLWMMNKPSLVLRYHEKLVPLEAVAQGFLAPEEIIANYYRGRSGLEESLKAQGISDVVAKPFFGYGGRGVQRVPFGEADSINQEENIIQPFHPEVMEDGDRRVFYIGGEYVGQIARIPKAGDFISNFAQGGSAADKPLSERQRKVVDKLGKFLSAVGIDFAGADLIGECISEVNITSPTGLVAMEEMDGVKYAEKVLDFTERQSKSVQEA